jgi:poly(A) polymerase
MTEREFAIAVVRKLHQAGHRALWAGGCVRDQLLGLEPDDYDIASDARPEEVAKLFRRTIAVGASFGVVEVLGAREHPELRVQVAAFRSDGAYIDGRHPQSVHFSSPEADAQRRDFTINGLFFDPLQNQVIDYVGGRADLDARLLRAIGDPRERFREDKLRLMRGVRMAARFGLAIEPATLAAMHAMADQINAVSAERIADELKKMLALPDRAVALDLLMQVGLIRAILPELMGEHGAAGQAKDDAWQHALRRLESLPDTASFALGLACVLMHVDPQGAQVKLPREKRAAVLAGQICRRLKLSVAERERVEWLVENQHRLSDAENLPMSALKRILCHPGSRELLELHRAEAMAEGRPSRPVEFCESKLATWGEADLNPPALVTGNDIAALGMRPGPQFKLLLDKVRDAQLDGLVATRKNALEFLAREMQKAGEGN